MDERNSDEELPDQYEDPDADFDGDEFEDDDPGDELDAEDLDDFADYTDEHQDKPKVVRVTGDIDDLAPDLANAPVLEPPD